MDKLEKIFDQNRAWADRVRREDPDFFEKSALQQSPKYLWIGCSDSRVPANQIMGLRAGEVFVHRNVGNLVVHTDFNCHSVLQYAVDVLGVNHVIVCGHYQCGGIRAALEPGSIGVVSHWIQHVEDVYTKFGSHFKNLSFDAQWDRLCELNVVEQVFNVCRSEVVQRAWDRGHDLCIHGWIYSLEDGLLQDLNVNCDGPDDVWAIYRSAIGLR
jgi:carbonic anhydrase